MNKAKCKDEPIEKRKSTIFNNLSESHTISSILGETDYPSVFIKPSGYEIWDDVLQGMGIMIKIKSTITHGAIQQIKISRPLSYI